MDQKGIKDSFTTFYQKLSQKQEILDSIRQCLEELPDIQNKELITNRLNEPIELEEIEAAINQTHLGKSPGPDGVSVKFHKLLKAELSPILKLVLNNLLNHGSIPKTWNEALITLIQKEGQDPLNVRYKRTWLY